MPPRQRWLIASVPAVFAAVVLAAVLARGTHEDQELAALEAALLGGGQESYQAYRSLVQRGEPGWRVICRHEFRIDRATDHLRGPMDIGGLDEDKADGFWLYSQERADELMADEAWAMAYAASCQRAYHRSHLWPPQWMAHLEKSREHPGTARCDIASLRCAFGKDFAFPWAGPEDEQRAAIDRWLAYWKTIEGDYMDHLAPAGAGE